MKSKPKIVLFGFMALLIACIGFAIGQGKEGAGVPVVILLTAMWAIYAQRRWGSQTRG